MATAEKNSFTFAQETMMRSETSTHVDLHRRHLITEHCRLTSGSSRVMKGDQRKLAAYTANFIELNYLLQVHVIPCQCFRLVPRVI